MNGSTNWDERCRKCADDIDWDCPYAGDPDGCNSPTHGHYPTTTVGNAATLREALVEVLGAFEQNILGPVGNHPETWEIDFVHGVWEGVSRALDAPARNCDVGTLEEQGSRFDDFCHARKPHGCESCPCYTPEEVDCQLVWAQMPYEKKEEDSNG